MKELKICIGKKEWVYGVPENWEDLSQSGFVALVKELRSGGVDRISRGLAVEVCGIDMGCALTMGAWHWHCLASELRWMLDIGGDEDGEGGVDCLMVENIDTRGGVLYGYEPDFSNTTWEEFITADTCAMRGDDAGLCAVLYRPERKPRDPERDVRIDYSRYGMIERREALTHVDDNVLLAARVNYMALRGLFAKRFPHVFVERDVVEERDDESGFSWMAVTKMIVGDKIGEWEAYNRLPCDVVLSRIETNIRESDRR